MYEKNTGNASPFASLSGRCLLCPVCRAAGVGRCGAFAPRGPKPPPAEACHCGRVPQTSTRRYGAADLRVGILPEEPISSVVYFFLLCFWLDPKAPKDQALRKERKQCDCAGLRPAKTEYRGIQIVINHRCAQRTANLHCTGGGIRSDGGSSARSGCAKQSSLLCPLSENRRPIPTEVPCGHFWRHLLVPKGGKSAPRRKNRIEGEGILPEESIGKLFFA